MRLKAKLRTGKRGQVTIFIIAGVIILFAAFFIGYLQNETFRQKIETNLFGASVVPEQAKNVVAYVENCMEDVLEEGAVKMGMQGGYIEIPDYIKSNPRTYLNVAGMKIPYWLYGEDNLKVLSKEEMEFDLKKYIENNFDVRCNLEQFENSGYVFDKDKVNVKVEIDDEDIRASLNSKFNTIIKEKTYDLKDYILVGLDIPLGELWESARVILDRELRNGPLEFNTLNLISIYSKDKDYFPPIAGFDFKCGGRKWSYANIKETLRQIVTAYTPYIRLEGSKNENDLSDDFYESMKINRIEKSLRDITISIVYYPDWPFYFDVYPREGDVIKAGGINYKTFLFGVFCLNLYDFRYTAVYPVLINLERGDYRFAFPIEVFLKDNYARKNFFGEDVSETSLKNPKKNLFCDEDQRLSANVNLLIKDGFTSEYLTGVEVSYRCGLETCFLNETKQGILNEKFPLCKGGELILSKEGYADYKQKLDALVKKEIEKIADLEPFRTKKASVRVLELDEDKNVVNERDLRENEVVYVQLNKINEDLLGYDYQTMFTIEGNTKEEIQIVPGDYAIDAQLQAKQKIVLPQQEIEGSIFEGGEIEDPIIGGMKINRYFLRKETLDSNKEIVIYVVSYGLPENIGDVSKGFELEEFDYKPILK